MIAIAGDHAAYHLKQEIAAFLQSLHFEYKDFGAYDTERCDYPVYGHRAATAVAEGICDKGILICGTGIGISIAANKVKGIRCVVCSEPYSAVLSKLHNDTNMLALGARVVGPGLAKLIVERWLAAEFEGGRHMDRIAQIQKIESGKAPIDS